MSAPKPPRKTAFAFALDKIATPETKTQLLQLTHGLVTTAMKKALLDTKGKTAETRAAEATCFAEILDDLEKELGANYSSAITVPTRVMRVPPNQMPPGSKPTAP